MNPKKSKKRWFLITAPVVLIFAALFLIPAGFPSAPMRSPPISADTGSIGIVNIQSYPTVGGNWTVRFNTTGTFNLTITAADGTDFNRDLVFLELICGDDVLAAELTDGAVFVEDYSCGGTAYAASKVLTTGKHALKFESGSSVAYAFNQAGASGFRVQQGDFLFSGTDAYIPLDYIVDTSRAFVIMQNLMFQENVTGATSGDPEMNDDDALVTAYLYNTTHIRVQRYAGDDGDLRIGWQVLESFNNEFTVQRGEKALSSFTGTSTTDTIPTAVDPAKTLAWHYIRTNKNWQWGNITQFYSNVSDSTTITFERAHSESITGYLRWVVVEWDTGELDSFSQGYVTGYGTNSTPFCDNIGTTINKDQSILIFQTHAISSGDLDTSTTAGNISSNTQVCFHNYDGSYNRGIKWYVIDFGSGVGNRVESGKVFWALDDYINEDTISPAVQLNRSLAWLSRSGNGDGMAKPRHTQWWVIEGNATHADTFRYEKRYGGQDGEVTWEVLELPYFLRPPKVTIDYPPNSTITDTTPDLNFTVNWAANVTYSWDGEGNISGCRNCSVFNTTYGENNGSDANLVALYHFNENFSNTTYDDSGTGNDGTLGNATAGTQPVWTTGKFGPALSFDGSNDFMNVSDDSSIDFGAQQDFTLSAWIRSNGTGRQMIFNKYGGTNDEGYHFDICGEAAWCGGGNWSTGMVHESGSTDSVVVYGTTELNDGAWHHVAMVADYTVGQLMIYVDGVNEGNGSLAAITNSLENSLPLYVGRYNTGSFPFNGTIDEVAIYNRSLSSAEIQELYNRSLSIGQHRVTVYANDTAGNSNSTTRWFTIGTTPLVITIDSPSSGTINDATPDLNFTTSETANVTYSWDSEGNISGCRNCTVFNTTYGENNGSDTKLNLLFHFNENLSNMTYDDSGTGNNGTLGNTTAGTQPAWTIGKFGPALEFDSEDDFVNVSDSSSLDFTENLTIAAWVYPRFTSWPGYTGAVSKDSAYALGMGGGKLRLSLYNGTGWSNTNSPGNVPLDQWVHIAGTFNGSWVKLYINGTEVISQAVSADWGNSIVTSDYPLQVGYYTGQTYFNGTIDEVAIYNRSLSGTEIQELYSKSLSQSYHCVTVYATDSAGNLTSTNRCFTVSVQVPTKLLAGTNRFSVWAPYTNVQGYELDNLSSTFITGALVMDQNGVALAGENVTFNISSAATWKATITNTTNANGIAYATYDTFGVFTGSAADADYGTWQVVAIVTDDTSINATRNLQIDSSGYTASGCGNTLCHNNPGAADKDYAPLSPYSDKFGSSTNIFAADAHTQQSGGGGSPRVHQGSCETCHSGYGKSSTAPATSYPWGTHTNVDCEDSGCHGSSVFTSFPPNMPSCYDCHPNNNNNLSTIDTTVTVNGIAGATVYSRNHELGAPLMAHTTNKTYNMSKGIPCWICHGPMHNITKPDPASANTNTYTEDSQCKTCHSPKTEHNNAVNCTTCHSQDAHNISFFNTTGNYIKNSGSAGDCTTCHQQTTAWDTLLTQPKVGTYGGSGPPQVPVPLNHSDNATGQRWGSYWTTGNDLSACNYCHGDTKHSAAALGRPANWSGANTVNSSINATNNWCAGCHYQGYTSGSKSYDDMVSEFTGVGLSVPPEITSNASHAPSGTAGYFNHSLGSYSDKMCSYCHDGLAPSATNISSLLHNVGTGRQCENCHFNWSKMNGTFDRPLKYMNETRFTQSVHGTSSVFPSVIFCTSCHTKLNNGTDYHLTIDPGVFTPPQSGWKWCEDCHVVNQTTPASNRHNLTDNPATNMFNSTSSVMDVTDCTTCHNATMYNSAKATYNKTSGKNCRFCHAFPDLLPGGD